MNHQKDIDWDKARILINTYTYTNPEPNPTPGLTPVAENSRIYVTEKEHEITYYEYEIILIKGCEYETAELRGFEARGSTRSITDTMEQALKELKAVKKKFDLY